MEFEVRDWLDELIRIKNEAENIESLNPCIEAIMYSPSCIQLHKGIEIVADLMGFELLEEIRSDGKTELSFNYAEEIFLQIGRSEDKP